MSEKPQHLTALDLARQKRAQMKADGIDVKILNPTEKALADPKSRSKAIRATCYECLGAEDCPNVRNEIGHCMAFDCALWHLRPYRENATNPDGTPFGTEKRATALKQAEIKNMANSLLLSAARRPKSATAAIRARCVQCQGNRMDVTNCPSVFGKPRGDSSHYFGCPLYPVRPYQTGTQAEGKDTDAKDESDEGFPDGN